MTKSQLRKKYKTLRNNLSQKQRDDLSLVVANNLLDLPNIWNYEFYHIFISIKELWEINTDYILSILLGKDKNVVVSKCDLETYSMSNFLLTDRTVFKKNKYQIPEPTDGILIPPKDIDVVFIPLLAFDQQGNRVGYGTGCYDRFLADCPEETFKIGLSFFEAETTTTFPVDSRDIKMDCCVTPQTIYKF